MADHKSSTFEYFRDFILNKMSMSHIYQPVMMLELLKRNGKASTEEIAQAILNRDPTQVDYYKQVVTNMVGKVLTKNRGITSKDGPDYLLHGSESLTDKESSSLMHLCEQKIIEYEKKREGAHWEHRRRSRNPVSGSVRYEVLKRAQFRCELCGISAEEKSLEVDHIHPKSLGGKDELFNYQALCFTCNAQKRNLDKEDFRGLKALYEHRDNGCLFCEVPVKDPSRVIDENSLAYVIRDGFAVTEGHSLFMPKRHVKDYFGLTQPEINAINQLLQAQKANQERKDKTITGYNIGMNCGESSGQTIFHCHVHLIPRRNGDVENPRGGIRHVIPGKGYYKA